MEQTTHLHLDCGVEVAVAPMPQRHAVALELRVLTGTADEPPDCLGLARLVRETIDKGTEQRDGRALLDAFDEIGASLGSSVGREATRYTCICLPEFLDRAIELHAEFLRHPTFPDEAAQAAIMLAQQELAALEDDPPSLVDMLIGRQGFGPVLGRHPLGNADTLTRLTREHFVDHWRASYGAGRIQAIAAGPIEPDAVSASLDRHLGGFGLGQAAGREGFAYDFEPARSHCHKDLEQEQIALCFPSAAVTDADFPAERVVLGILAGGMSARLFTEVREKQGLAYDVHAANENPRGHGMIFVSAACKPDRAETTFQTLLREIERLSEDLEPEELDRAKTRLLAREETLADMTRSRRNALSFDLFHHGRPIPVEERLERVRAVGMDDVRRYLQSHPRDRLSIVTLGPTELSEI